MGDKESVPVKDSPGREPDAKSIEVLAGLEAVRLRPAMYIGSTGDMGLHHLVCEVVDNSVDEALAGYADHINVTVHVDDSGSPSRIMAAAFRSICTNRQSALRSRNGTDAAPRRRKFDSGGYKVAGGLHGVGVSSSTPSRTVSNWKSRATARCGNNPTKKANRPRSSSRPGKLARPARQLPFIRTPAFSKKQFSVSIRFRSACANLPSSTKV